MVYRGVCAAAVALGHTTLVWKCHFWKWALQVTMKSRKMCCHWYLESWGGALSDQHMAGLRKSKSRTGLLLLSQNSQ
jgi:hypothetical protein